MKKYILYFILFFFVIPMVFVGIGAGIYYLAGGDEDESVQDEVQEIVLEDNPQQELEKKIADFERRHKELASLPPRSYKDEFGLVEYSNYPDDYYNETQQLYKEEIAFNLEQYGEDATAKVVFILNQIPITGQYYIGTLIAPTHGHGGLRYDSNHEYYPEAFDAVCAQIAHNAINSICDYAISLAIGYGYNQMAKRILSCYKPNIIIKLVGHENNRTTEYNLVTTYQSRDNAKARIAEL